MTHHSGKGLSGVHRTLAAKALLEALDWTSNETVPVLLTTSRTVLEALVGGMTFQPISASFLDTASSPAMRVCRLLFSWILVIDVLIGRGLWAS